MFASLRQYISNPVQQKRIFIILVIGSMIIKQILVMGIPIWVRDYGGGDEWLMIELGEHLLNGKWLGDYNCLTLAKGMMFPLFLAICCKIGVSYICGINILYAAICVLALYVISRFIKSYLLCYIFYFCLLFSPIMYNSSLALVYRNILIVPFAILLICGLIMMYYTVGENNCKLSVWVFLSGLAWSILWHTREDTIWTLPLVGVAFIMCTVKTIRIYKVQLRKCIINLILCITPIIMLLLSIQCISAINYHYYGVWTTNELKNSSFAKVYKEIIRIKPDREIDYVLITHDMMSKAFEHSPTLALIEDRIETMYTNREGLVTAGRNPDNGEVNENLMVWVLAGEPFNLGIYDNARAAEEYWSNVLDELETAIDNGGLATRKTMPSASLIPFPQRDDRWESLFHSIGIVFKYCFTYGNDLAYVYKTDPAIPENCIRRYENLTGNYSVNHDRNNIVISGWVFNENNQIYTAALEKDNAIIQPVILGDSADIYNGFHESYVNNTTLKNARFYVNTTLDDVDNTMLVFRNEQNEIKGTIDLKDGTSDFSTDSVYHIDEYINNTIPDVKYEVAQSRVDRLNFIGHLYQRFNGFVFWVVLLYWIINTLFVYRIIRIGDEHEFIKWLILTASLGCVLLINVSLAYVDAFMFGTSGSYLSAAQAIGSFFTSFGLVVILDKIIKTYFLYRTRR